MVPTTRTKEEVEIEKERKKKNINYQVPKYCTSKTDNMN
jgi:hypothetical protein